jgi:hypothetical protein
MPAPSDVCQAGCQHGQLPGHTVRGTDGSRLPNVTQQGQRMGLELHVEPLTSAAAAAKRWWQQQWWRYRSCSCSMAAQAAKAAATATQRRQQHSGGSSEATAAAAAAAAPWQQCQQGGSSSSSAVAAGSRSGTLYGAVRDSAPHLRALCHAGVTAALLESLV